MWAGVQGCPAAQGNVGPILAHSGGAGHAPTLRTPAGSVADPVPAVWAGVLVSSPHLRCGAGVQGCRELLSGVKRVPCAPMEGSDVLVCCFCPPGDLAYEDNKLGVEYRVYDPIVADANPIEILG